MKNTFNVTVILFALTLCGCSTYHVSTQSLLEQFANTKTEKKENVIIAFPFIFPGEVTGNDLKEIKCQDKNGNEIIVPVTNHTGVRITKKDGSRKTFYFDTLLIKDSTINGKKSHFVGLDIKPINLNDIEKIELQR
jgi:hypothetical protein